MAARRVGSRVRARRAHVVAATQSENLSIVFLLTPPRMVRQCFYWSARRACSRQDRDLSPRRPFGFCMSRCPEGCLNSCMLQRTEIVKSCMHLSPREGGLAVLCTSSVCRFRTFHLPIQAERITALSTALVVQEIEWNTNSGEAWIHSSPNRYYYYFFAFLVLFARSHKDGGVAYVSQLCFPVLYIQALHKYTRLTKVGAPDTAPRTHARNPRTVPRSHGHRDRRPLLLLL